MSAMGAGATRAGGTAAPSAEPRVRDLAREAVALMTFSAGLSLCLFLVVLLGSWLGR